jgi:hypothetical protein
MDQLKVLLVHRFWILSALAILIPPISWWMSTGDMAKQTDVRAKQIDGSIKKIQGLSKDLSKAANTEWIKGAEQVNVKLGSLVNQTHKRLYEHQRPVMTWHPVVRKGLDEANVKYRGDNAANPQAFLSAKKFYIARYADQWQQAFQTVEPFSWTTGDGKVWCAGQDANGQAEITKGPVDSWQQRQNISSEEMWDAQEDLWMLQALLKAVARVNEGSISIDDARIKKLTVAILRGGNLADRDDRRKPKSGPGAGGKAAPVGGQAGDGTPRPMPIIDPDDIFGADDSSSAPRAAGNVKGGFGGGGGGAESGGRRYVAVSSGKWRSRGFILRVVMDHQEIPKLLTMLSDSPFPVQIWQVEHDVNNPKNNKISASAPESDADPKRAKERQQRVMMALSQPYLADVMIAGTFTFYDAPAAANAQTSAGKAAPVPTLQGTKAPAVAPTVPPAKAGPTKSAAPAPAPGTAPASAGATKSPSGGGASQLPQGPKAKVTRSPSGAPQSTP